MVGDPGIEGRGRLFEQRQLRDAGFVRGQHGQLARFFVEGGGNGQDHVLVGRASASVLLSQASRMWLQVARRDFDRRENAAAFLRVPGQDLRGAVDVRIREPALGGVDELGRHQRALLARVGAGVELVAAEEQERRQRAARLDLAPRRRAAGIGRMWMGGKSSVFGFSRVDVGEGGVGGAEVDADVHAFTVRAH